MLHCNKPIDSFLSIAISLVDIVKALGDGTCVKDLRHRVRLEVLSRAQPYNLAHEIWPH